MTDFDTIWRTQGEIRTVSLLVLRGHVRIRVLFDGFIRIKAHFLKLCCNNRAKLVNFLQIL